MTVVIIAAVDLCATSVRVMTGHVGNGKLLVRLRIPLGLFGEPLQHRDPLHVGAARIGNALLQARTLGAIGGTLGSMRDLVFSAFAPHTYSTKG